MFSPSAGFKAATAFKCVYADLRSFQIIRVVELEKTEDVKRPYIRQLLTKDLKFPLPHRITKASATKVFSAERPSTFA